MQKSNFLNENHNDGNNEFYKDFVENEEDDMNEREVENAETKRYEEE